MNCGQFRDMREKYFEKNPYLIPHFLKLSRTDQQVLLKEGSHASLSVRLICALHYYYYNYCLHTVCGLNAFFFFFMS